MRIVSIAKSCLPVQCATHSAVQHYKDPLFVESASQMIWRSGAISVYTLCIKLIINLIIQDGIKIGK